MKVYSQEMRDYAVRKYKEGYGGNTIAKEIGCIPGTVLQWVRKAGEEVRTRPKMVRAPDEVRQEAVRLYAEGLGTIRVGKKIGYSESAVRNFLKEAGVKMRPQPWWWWKEDDPTSPWAECNDW